MIIFAYIVFHYSKGLVDYSDWTDEKSKKKYPFMLPFMYMKESPMFKLFQHTNIACFICDNMSYFWYKHLYSSKV